VSLQTQEERIALVASLIRDVPDFPKPGVVYKDITPLLANHQGYQAAIDALVEAAPKGIDVVVGMEARGFVFAAPVALALGVGFVPVRKPGKLPMNVFSESFALEYGSDSLSVHQDAIQPHARVLVIDDVLATGGTVGATSRSGPAAGCRSRSRLRSHGARLPRRARQPREHGHLERGRSHHDLTGQRWRCAPRLGLTTR
jgi:adenine phosphoribosyltransferase